eukprot:Skav231928  [mRNA]  locus=scaffold2322:141122:143617:- [translate_table: standard]
MWLITSACDSRSEEDPKNGVPKRNMARQTSPIGATGAAMCSFSKCRSRCRSKPLKAGCTVCAVQFNTPQMRLGEVCGGFDEFPRTGRANNLLSRASPGGSVLLGETSRCAGESMLSQNFWIKTCGNHCRNISSGSRLVISRGRFPEFPHFQPVFCRRCVPGKHLSCISLVQETTATVLKSLSADEY